MSRCAIEVLFNDFETGSLDLVFIMSIRRKRALSPRVHSKKPFKNNWLNIASILAIAPLLIVFSGVATANPPPQTSGADLASKPVLLRDETKNYPPMDSGLYGADWYSAVQGWLDNYTVVFMGFRSEGERHAKYPQPLTANLYSWNTRTKQTTVYSEQATNACAFDGYLRYVEVDSTGGYTVYAGRPPAFEKLAYYRGPLIIGLQKQGRQIRDACVMLCWFLARFRWRIQV